MASHKSVTPQQDTGWGVIYRLNDLFRQVEELAPSGKYDDWNFKLDRIWSNLLYRDKLEIKEANDNIVSIEFNEEPYKIKMFFDSEIVKAKSEMRNSIKGEEDKKSATKKKEYIHAKNKLYKIILKKEIWLRKFMSDLGLYLKEVEHNPAGAMFGR